MPVHDPPQKSNLETFLKECPFIFVERIKRKNSPSLKKCTLILRGSSKATLCVQHLYDIRLAFGESWCVSCAFLHLGIWLDIKNPCITWRVMSLLVKGHQIQPSFWTDSPIPTTWTQHLKDVFYKDNSKPLGGHFVTWLCLKRVDPLSPLFSLTQGPTWTNDPIAPSIYVTSWYDQTHSRRTCRSVRLWCLDHATSYQKNTF